MCDPRKYAPEIADFSADVFLLKRARVSPGLPVDGVDLVAPIDKAKRETEKGILDVIVEVAGEALVKAVDWVAGKIGSALRGW